MDSVVEFSGQASGPPQGGIQYCCRSDDYVQKFGHHAIDIREAVAVRCKIAFCSIEAVTTNKLTWAVFIYSEDLLYYILLLKRYGISTKECSILLQQVVAVRCNVQSSKSVKPV
jgi:hypothetical protein